MTRIVFHIDVNSAFLSWSAKQVLDKWYTRDIRNDVSVVWFKEKWKSIIVAASTPAKKLWIRVPMRLYEVQKIYPKVIIAPPDYEYYKKCSDWWFFYAMGNCLKRWFNKKCRDDGLPRSFLSIIVFWLKKRTSPCLPCSL